MMYQPSTSPFVVLPTSSHLRGENKRRSVDVLRPEPDAG